MELKDRNNHYLHPDFEDIDMNNEKKQSPLALLAQTCKNIGSIKDDRTFSPNSTMNGHRKLSKRCRSDSSSNSSLTEREYLSPVKIGKKKRLDIVELKHADTSSEIGFIPSSSLITNLLNLVKNSNTEPLINADKVELLHFLAGQTDSSRSNDCPKKSEQFNVEKGYHLETREETECKDFLRKRHNFQPQDKTMNRTFSAIKYCMYCGRLIPVLPMLLAHIRLEHNGTTEQSQQYSPNPSVPNIYDSLVTFNPYLTSTGVKPDQTFSFLTDYLSSNFQGLNNLIC